VRLLADPRVAERWSQPSALAGYTVGGLAGHILFVLTFLVDSLDREEPSGGIVRTAAEWYGGARIASRDDLDGPIHRGVRENGEGHAAPGGGAVAAAASPAVDRLRSRLADLPRERLVPAPMAPRLATRLDEQLRTRVVELLVHADDLAVSCGIAPPVLPAEAAGIAIDLLVATCRHRSGDLAVLRALTRAERADPDTLRAL
jgi:uncharacterized protein (TIGR03083 family)